jgi:FlgN protein
MTTTPISRQLPASTSLAEMCQALMVREESCLRACLAALEQFRKTLASNAPGAPMQAAANCKEAACLLVQVREQRDQFQQAAANVLEVSPATLTLRMVAEHLPLSDSIVVMRGRHRLRELAEEIDRVNQGNALIIWWCLDFVQRVFAAIQGHPSAGRYSAGGKVQAGVCGPIWQGQG